MTEDPDRRVTDPEDRSPETLDRQLGELTSELRMVLPGVTVLFAFLLGLPFTTRFADLTTLQAGAFFTAFASCASAVVLLLGEAAHHQLAQKPYSKGRLLRIGGRGR